MNKFVSEWEQVIPFLPPNDIKRLEEILKQVQKQNEKNCDSTSPGDNAAAASSSSNQGAATIHQNNNNNNNNNNNGSVLQSSSDVPVQEQSSQLSTNSSQRPASSCKEELMNSRSTSPSSDISSNAPAMKSSSSMGKTFETGRRNLKDENVNDDEAKRRAKRRERNRIAAAMCRKRRQDHISHLQVKVNKMKAVTHQLNEHLQMIIKEKTILNNLLHEHNCVMRSVSPQRFSAGTASNTSVAAPLQPPPVPVNSSSNSTFVNATQSVITRPHLTVVDIVESNDRPCSLPIPMSAFDNSVLDQVQVPAGSELDTLANLTPLMTPGVWNTLKESINSSSATQSNNMMEGGGSSQSFLSHSTLRLDYSELSREANYLALLSPTKTLIKNQRDPPASHHHPKKESNSFFPITAKNDKFY